MSTIAVIGSSGGGAATLGHTDPAQLLQLLHAELGSINHGIRRAIFVSLNGGKGLDGADPDTSNASLYTVSNDSNDDNNNNINSSSNNNNNDNNNNNNNSNGVDTSLGSQQQQCCPVQVACTGTLRQVNEACHNMNLLIAKEIREGKIKALVCISCSVDVHRATLEAAASAKIPVTGSGGTSLSAVATMYDGAMKIQLVGNAGGSVATTSYTRAVSYTYALASTWKIPYHPCSKNHNNTNADKETPHWRSVLEACLPAFWGVCLTCRLLETLGYGVGEMARTIATGGSTEGSSSSHVLVQDNDIQHFVWFLKSLALPTTASVVMATSANNNKQDSSTAVMAACLASIAVCKDSVLGGLFAGWCVSWCLGRALFFCIRNNIPATMTNLIVAGGVGCWVALLMHVSGIVPYLALATHWMRWALRQPLLPSLPTSLFITEKTPSPQTPFWFPSGGAGFLFGCLFCYGSKIGWYHSLFLPVILLEMERGDASVWGAVDEVTLVLVSAGICSANLLSHLFFYPSPSSSSSSSSSSLDQQQQQQQQQQHHIDNADQSLCWRGLRINLLCGDFIEVAYPFMEQSKLVNMSAYLACGVATEILYRQDPSQVLSSAYVPVMVSVWLAKDRKRMALSCMAASGISFLGTLLNNIIVYNKKSNKKGKQS